MDAEEFRKIKHVDVSTLAGFCWDYMIAPHEGKELELMLAGTKNLAMFHDAVLPDREISEDIIPENVFAPYVEKDEILRFSKDIHNVKTGGIIRYVLFSLPDEGWRAEFVLWLKQEWLDGHVPHNPANDAIIGRLLGYDERDIAEFLSKQS